MGGEGCSGVGKGCGDASVQTVMQVLCFVVSPGFSVQGFVLEGVVVLN